MERETALRILKRHRRELKNLGVKSLAVFGSIARNEATPESDVDILVEYEGPATFDGFMETKFYLEKILGRPVDLVTKQALKPGLRPSIEREAVYVS
jgi:predicted nucleotidyltransferase